MASSDRESYSNLLHVFNAYSEGKVKKQVIPKTKQGIDNIELDCKGANFKCLRNLSKEDTVKMLDNVATGKLSFGEMAAECHIIKQRRIIREQFMEKQGISDWEEAKNNFPKYTSDSALDQFLDVPFNKACPQVFLDYCRRASLSNSTQIDSNAAVNSFTISEGKIILVDGSPATFGYSNLMDYDRSVQCGIALLFVDIRNKPSTFEDYVCYIEII